MDHFFVELSGEGIEIPTDDGSAPIVGFYRICLVRANSASEAEKAARELVEADWKSEKYSRVNRGMAPRLKTESIHRASFFKRFRFTNGSHIFYPRNVAAD